ncbi:hypothetical protein EXIGLDRAFT_754032 [Exidia glandulosa HHB12029]|uniref:Uncharacterized protein n=1 Tax=Exidia glandulosa HHB12029 TaxID=1314781 RepID=A0A165DAV2_EXIGL|nr:hypothetical protein EXIGLDRAFT_754032 [Exidia glandulosa HHB12029]
MTTPKSSSQQLDEYHEYLENVKKVSSVDLRLKPIATLTRHEGLCAARILTLCSSMAVTLMVLKRYSKQDASAHLENVHGLGWGGEKAIVDENGEPRIGLFDDIVRAEPDHSLRPRFMLPPIYYNIFIRTNSSYSEETGVVEQVDDSSLHAIITEQLRDGNDTDRLQRVWDIIQQDKLRVHCIKHKFPIISGNFSLSQELIARARLHFETNTTNDVLNWGSVSFIRHVLAGGGANTSSQVRVFMRRQGDEYDIEVEACTHHNTHIQYNYFRISIPAVYPLLAAVARAAGLPDDFEHSWNGSSVYIYPQLRDEGEQTEEESNIGDGKGADEDSGNSGAWDSSVDEEDEEYETAEEGETSSDDAGQE